MSATAEQEQAHGRSKRVTTTHVARRVTVARSLAGVVRSGLLVPGVDRHHAERLRAKYQQDAVICLGPETERRVHILREAQPEDLGQFDPSKIAAAFSSSLGGPCSLDWVTNSFGEALMDQDERPRVGVPPVLA